MTFVLILFGAFFSGCEAIDALLPSAGHYKVNFQINDVLLDDCSFIRYNDKIFPFFEESVSDDKDITSLVVFLRDAAGEIAGRRVSYSIRANDSSDLIIPVKSLDDNLPFFPIPGSLSMGRYTLVFQVMSGKNILQRTERNIFYLGGNNFSFQGINIHIPGKTETPLLIPKDTKIMLEANLNFSSRFNPYIIWYDGKNKIGEGKISDGAGTLFWQAPEQSGFFSLRAEVFPVENPKEFSGYKNEVSMLVSSMTNDYNLLNDIPQLVYWYTLEGDLNDSKKNDSENALKPAGKNSLVWKGLDGTYGLASGQNNAFIVPKVFIQNNNLNTWQTLFRFSPLDDGVILSILFGNNNEVSLSLIKEKNDLILVLQSSLETVSQVFNLPVKDTEAGTEAKNTFITAGIVFSIMPSQLTANINLLGFFIENELSGKPLSVKISIDDEFQIVMGSIYKTLNGSSEADEESTENIPEIKSTLNAIWDEFALYHMPPMETIIAKLRPIINEN